MTTVRQIISRSLRLIEEVGTGQTMTAEQGADGLTSLVSMLGSWSIQNGMIYTETMESFNLTSGDGEYTIGTGGDFNTVRPISITSAFIRDNGTDFPLSIIGADEYSRYSNKSDTGIPTSIYYDANYPLGGIKLLPVPDAAYTIHLTSEKPLSSFSSLNDTVSMPEGYERGIVYNLAIEQAPEYGKSPSQIVVRIAGESKKAIESANSLNNNETLSVDNALINFAYNVNVE